MHTRVRVLKFSRRPTFPKYTTLEIGMLWVCVFWFLDNIVQRRPVERGKFSRALRRLGASLKNTETGVPDGFFLNSSMHKIHFWRPGPHWGELTVLLQTPSLIVRGHSSPCFLLFLPSASRSRRIWNEFVIGPRDNGFPGPAVALDGPVSATKMHPETLVSGDISFARLFAGFHEEWASNTKTVFTALLFIQVYKISKAPYTPPTPTRRNCFVASRRRRRCVHELATSSGRLLTDSAMWTQPMAVTKFAANCYRSRIWRNIWRCMFVNIRICCVV